MSEETTQNLPDNRSFEERVFARFDAIDARLNDMDSRLQTLEQKSYDTKPIWERALAEIQAISEKLDTVERKFNVLSLDMVTLRADQTRLETRMNKLEDKPSP
ncbi:MAG TPA: hypothetical protein VF658_12960 [Pyrinomonadaceae bacterium]|jgi:archaellum component FlaC